MAAITKDEPTIAAVCERHISSLSGVTARTRADYRRDAKNHITPHLGALPISLPDDERMRQWINELEPKMSGKTLRNIHGLMSGVMAFAVAKKLRSDNPCRGIRLPAYLPTEMVFLETWEYDILRAHVPEKHHLLVDSLAATGARWGEATAWIPEDFKFPDEDDEETIVRISKAWKRTDTGYMIGPPKTRKSNRTVTISRKLTAPLRVLVANTEPSCPVFQNSTGGHLYRPVFGERVWQPAVSSARAKREKEGNEVPHKQRLPKKPRIHDLRHSHASWLIASGIDIKTVQLRLGHESVVTTVDRHGRAGDVVAESEPGQPVAGKVLATPPRQRERFAQPDPTGGVQRRYRP